jgi:hypothetical protein
MSVEGNEFCAFIDPDRPVAEPRAHAFAVCTDSDRPEKLAAWWAPLLGAAIGPGSDGTMRWLYGAGGRPDLIWKFVRVADERLREESTAGDERVVPNRWQWSVTAGLDELVDAGASATHEDLFVGPGGNEVSAPGPVSSAG